MGFEDLLALLADPGDDGLPDTFSDDLRASYGDATTTRDAKIGELETGHGEKDATIEALKAEIARQKIINYDLLMATPGDQEEETSSSEEDNSEKGIDSLFEDD